MRWTIITLAGSVALLAGIVGADPAELKVCSDPDNLPYSNERQEGFENKIAEIVAKDLGASLTNFWWPHQRGLVRNTLRADKCDVLIDIPKGYDPVTWTKPYYRSAYVLVTKTDGGPKVTSLDDPAMKQVKRIGVHMNTPPSDALGDRGLQDNMRTYITFNDPRDPDPERRPLKMLEDVVSGELDAAIVWGPLAGYFAKLTQKNGGPALTLVPLADDRVIPLTFEMSMGVKKGDQALKAKLEQAIDHHQTEIRQVLEDYGVPLLPLKPPRAIAPAPAEQPKP